MGQNPIKTETINGILFHYGMAGYCGLGHWVDRAEYRAFYDHVCFELAADTSGVNSGAFEPGTIKEFDEAKLDKEFDAILSTFKFIGPVVDGPEWRVYHNEDVGGTFEYPDRDTVVKSIEYSAERQASNEITDSVFFSDRGLNYKGRPERQQCIGCLAEIIWLSGPKRGAGTPTFGAFCGVQCRKLLVCIWASYVVHPRRLRSTA